MDETNCEDLEQNDDFIVTNIDV